MKKDNTICTPRSQSGFTILELMIAVAIGAILVVMAVPSFEETVRRNRIDGEAQRIYGLIKQARSSAMMTNSPSFICRAVEGGGELGCRTRGLEVNDWGVELKMYTALSTTVVPVPNNSYANQRLNVIELNVDRRQEMLQKSVKAPNDGLVIRSARNDRVLRFNADGTVSNVTPFRIAVCDDSDAPDRYGQLIEINQSGQLRLTRVSMVDTNRDCTPQV